MSLYDDEPAITYNWKDVTKTVTLVELEAASENKSSGVSPRLGHPWGFVFYLELDKIYIRTHYGGVRYDRRQTR